VGRYFGAIVSWEKPPAGQIWRALFDDGHKVYLHEEDVAAIAGASGGKLPSVPLLVETTWLGRVKRWETVDAAYTTNQPTRIDYRQQLPSLDWDTLWMAPLWILSAIGGLDGEVTDAEMSALFRHMRNAASAPSILAQQVFAEIAQDAEAHQARFFADPRRANTGLREVGRLLESIDQDDAFEFRTHLFVLAKDVAKADGPVTPQEEQATIAIARLVGLVAADDDS
jgi:tellurite resistance protein